MKDLPISKEQAAAYVELGKQVEQAQALRASYICAILDGASIIGRMQVLGVVMEEDGPRLRIEEANGNATA